MASLLRVLMIEDVDADAQRILRELQRAGYDVDYQRVDTLAAMEGALLGKVWDIILCDNNLSHINTLEVLATLKESGHTLPFFLRDATLNEETWVTIFQAIAHDFIVKESPAQLLPAVARELQSLQTRRSPSL
jgi:CheY-like chemotaxis protein